MIIIKVVLMLLVAIFLLNGCSDANKPDRKLIVVWKLVESYQNIPGIAKIYTMIQDFKTEILSDKTFIQGGGWSGHYNFLYDG
jgi:hypothetical protein